MELIEVGVNFPRDVYLRMKNLAEVSRFLFREWTSV